MAPRHPSHLGWGEPTWTTEGGGESGPGVAGSTSACTGEGEAWELAKQRVSGQTGTGRARRATPGIRQRCFEREGCWAVTAAARRPREARLAGPLGLATQGTSGTFQRAAAVGSEDRVTGESEWEVGKQRD